MTRGFERSWAKADLFFILGSTMGLADKENAQELLEAWPELCRKHDIPCSAMHVGFTLATNSIPFH